MKIIPVILSGGSGKRLWPLSRKLYPKQYLSLVGDNSMLQSTVQRLEGLENLTEPIIICNEHQRFLALEQLQKIGITNPTILLEPLAKNTAAAIAAVAHYIKANEDKTKSMDSLLLVLSADHIILDISAFHQAIKIASEQALNGRLVTFGVLPTHPHTGYGYIKKKVTSTGSVAKIEKFVEKPDQSLAESYLEDGNYLWNSGMFVFKSDQLLNQMSIHAEDIFKYTLRSVQNATKEENFIRLEREAFLETPSNSIDYALMEKTDQGVVVNLDAGWNDVGSWASLYDIGNKDQNNNVISGDVIALESSNSYIKSDHHMVVVIGVDNMIIVDTPDATLISTKDKAQQVKDVVQKLQKEGRSEEQLHRKVYRPWGWYDSIESGKHFQVKRLEVNPGAKLSLQMHHNRAEHWVVVSGTATVTNGEAILTLTEGESTYIPACTLHSLENKTNEQLQVIEVQSGTYLGEDDIVRFEDIYGRTKG